MKFLTVLATVFYGGTIIVGADYYVEFRAPPTQHNFRGPPRMTDYLYECKSIPAGMLVYTAAQSLCTRVTSLEEKITIYRNCNFYSVYRPRVQGHVMRFSDRSALSTVKWNLGYLNHAIDHPNFAEPSHQVIAYFRTRIEFLGVDSVVPYYMVTSLTSYFAQTNLFAFSQDPVLANSHFSTFTNFLRRILGQDQLMEQETVMQQYVIRRQFEAAMNMALEKMIDPCAVLLGNLQRSASRHCATYCDFLSFASRRFNTCASQCSTLQGGHCSGVVCTCNRVITHPFAGCDPFHTSPMRFCYNSMRAELNQ